MSLFTSLRRGVIRQMFRRMARQLAEADAAALEEKVEQRVLEVFHDAARSAPGYRTLLAEERVDPAAIRSLHDFREEVPVIDKRRWFSHDLRKICRGGSLDRLISFYSSSGQTGFFSYGVESQEDRKRGALAVEFALQQAFQALDRRTLLLNCLPMGVRVHTDVLPVADTSVREDVVWSLLRKLEGDFEQFIFLSESPFLKHLIEGGAELSDPIPWKRLRVHLVTGAEYISEHLRTYLAALLGMDLRDPAGGQMIVNYGLSELSVSVAHENWHTIQIRRFAVANAAFCTALCGGDVPYCPNVMQYYPSQVYLETQQGAEGWTELVVTMLDRERQIPIVRYNTGDCAILISHARLAQVLRDFGKAEWIPPLALPVVLTFGKRQGLSTGRGTIYTEQVKDALYVDAAVAREITGNFRLRTAQDGPELLVQLRENASLSPQLENGLQAALDARLEISLAPTLLPYREFPFGMRHDFERKNRYIE